MVLCLVVIVAVTTGGEPLDASAWPVSARPPLSRPEQVLYWRLCEAFPEHIVLAQVAIAQLLEVNEVPNRRAVFNRYRQLVADFVVCTRAFEVVAVIELDDRTHQNPGRASADERKSAALGAAGLLLMRFNVRALPTAGELRSQLATAAPASSQPLPSAEPHAERRPAAA
jgi:very-short-patch-repair endonuclease